MRAHNQPWDTDHGRFSCVGTSAHKKRAILLLITSVPFRVRFACFQVFDMLCIRCSILSGSCMLAPKGLSRPLRLNSDEHAWNLPDRSRNFAVSLASLIGTQTFTS